MTLATDDWRSWPTSAKLTLSRRLWADKVARPEQLPPPGDWRVWYLQGGRGSGKTRSAAEAFASWVQDEPGEYAVVAPTYGDARDVCIEGRSGLIGRLPGLVANWNRSFGELRLNNGSVVWADGADDGALRIQGRNLRGAWCVAADELVKTTRGDVLISEVRPGDRVATRSGWCRVTAATLTKRAAQVVTVLASDGSSLRCTPDHLVLANSAWCDAGALVPGDTLESWTSSTARLHTAIGRACAGTTTTRPGAIEATPGFHSRRRSGRMRTDRSLRVSTFITSTTTPRTTTLQTSQSRNGPSIAANTLRPMERKRIPVLRDVLAPLLCGPPENLLRGSVNTARRPTSLVRRIARTAARDAVSPPVEVVSVKPSGCADVYDLTVEGAHEFFAGGLLVHNCDEVGLWRNWERAWHESLSFAVRLAPARIIASGTPKRGHGLVELLVTDDRIPKSRLRTLDNLANLSAAAVADLQARYAGTSRGRQELEGEWLEDVDGALWTLASIDHERRPQAPQLVRVVVAVDPAVTSGENADETGIVVAGLGADGHGYVLADESCRLSPERWAQRVVRAYENHRADRVVAEVNHGHDLVETVLRAVAPNLPYRKLNASQGKRIRAEPVAALYEQGRVHHVGDLAELEDQLCSWTPNVSKSPDRMDALVWALTDLMLEPERRVLRFRGAA